MRKPLVRIPLDDEMIQYILDAVASVDPVVMKRFRPEDRKILENIREASLEEGLHVLGLVGKRYCVVVADRGKVANRPPNIPAILRFFRKKVFKLVGSTLKDWGMFVRADKELVQALSLCSLEINARTMHLLRNYEEISAHIENVSDVYIRARVQLQSQLIVDNFLKEAFGVEQLFRHKEEQDRYKLKREQLPILFYFSANRQHQIPAIEVAVWSGQKDYSTKVHLLLEDMTRNGHLQRYETPSGYTYQLTGWGVYVVNQIRDRITYHT